MIFRIVFLLACLATLGARADILPLPSDYAPPEQRQQFALCRTAIIIEVNAPENSRTRLPPAAVQAMREQIDFIMLETIFSAPVLTYDDGVRRLRFTEGFILDFSRTVSTERARLSDPAEREPLLMECQPLLWTIVRQQIEVLIAWRRRAMALEGEFPGLAPRFAE